MPVDRLEVKISITKLLLALIVAVVPLSIIGLVLTQRSDRMLDDSVGNNFKSMARLYADEVTQFMRERVANVSVLATDPAVVAAATKQKAQVASGTTGSDDSSRAGTVLHQWKSVDPRFMSLVVTNSNGDVTAASQRPPKTSYADDSLWQTAFNNGEGSAKIGGIVKDELTKASYVTLNVPVTDGPANHTIGIVSAAVNITELLARFRQEHIGAGARASLINSDGKIISSPSADVFSRVDAPQFDYVRDAMATSEGRQAGWVMADVGNRKSVVGYANTGLKQRFQNLGWTVLVSQDEHAAAAPVRDLVHFALAMVVLGLFMLTLLCVYYYLHRTQRFARIEDQLAAEDVSNVRTAHA